MNPTEMYATVMSGLGDLLAGALDEPERNMITSASVSVLAAFGHRFNQGDLNMEEVPTDE